MTDVLIFGDIHGKFDAADQHYLSLVQIYGVPDLFIQVGDFGFWPKSEQPWTRQFDHPCLFVDGNHENHWVLRTLDNDEWGLDGGPTSGWEQTMDAWDYMPRGTIQDGILFVGGARSVNTRHAKRGLNWFPEENISHEEQRRIFENIDRYGPENIHTVISHDAPAAFNVSEGCTQTGQEIIDANRKILDAVRQQVRPKRWYFGHYHHRMEGVYKGTCWRCIDMIRSGSQNNDYVYLTL